MKLGDMFGGKTPLANTIVKKQEPKPKKRDISKIHVEWPKARKQGAKDYKVITAADALLQYLKRCEDTGYCGFDYETTASAEERARWAEIAQEYKVKLQLAEGDAKLTKQLENELKSKREDHLKSPLDPWRAEVCTVSLSAAPDEARVVYIDHKKGSKNFQGTREQVFEILDKHLFTNKNILKIAVPNAATLIILVLPYLSPNGPKMIVNNPKASIYAVTDKAALPISIFKSFAILIKSGATA